MILGKMDVTSYRNRIAYVTERLGLFERGSNRHQEYSRELSQLHSLESELVSAIKYAEQTVSYSAMMRHASVNGSEIGPHYDSGHAYDSVYPSGKWTQFESGLFCIVSSAGTGEWTDKKGLLTTNDADILPRGIVVARIGPVALFRNDKIETILNGAVYLSTDGSRPTASGKYAIRLGYATGGYLEIDPVLEQQIGS